MALPEGEPRYQYNEPIGPIPLATEISNRIDFIHDELKSTKNDRDYRPLSDDDRERITDVVTRVMNAEGIDGLTKLAHEADWENAKNNTPRLNGSYVHELSQAYFKETAILFTDERAVRVPKILDSLRPRTALVLGQALSGGDKYLAEIYSEPIVRDILNPTPKFVKAPQGQPGPTR